MSSFTALFVNEITKISSGLTPCFSTRNLTFAATVVVFPAPAPAITNVWSSSERTTSLCSSSSIIFGSHSFRILSRYLFCSLSCFWIKASLCALIIAGSLAISDNWEYTQRNSLIVFLSSPLVSAYEDNIPDFSSVSKNIGNSLYSDTIDA